MSSANSPEREEYNKLLMRLYEKNQEFLNKAIFTVSSAAIALLFNAISNEPLFYIRLTFDLALIAFLFVIGFQIFSLKIARDGCDEGMSSDEQKIKNSLKLFKKAQYLDKWREGFFVAALVLIAVAFIIKTETMETTMTKKTTTESQNKQASFTPPKNVQPKPPTKPNDKTTKK